jgi:hypothetical protein
MAAFKVISPLVEYLEKQGCIKAFAGMEGEKSKLVTLNFPTGPQNGDPFYFASDSSLDYSNACITAIELVDVVTLIDNNTAQGYKDNITATAAASGYLVFSDNKRQEIAVIPLYNLIRRLNNGKTTFLKIDTQIWQNCYVAVTNIAAFSPTTTAFTFRVSYVPKY